MNTISGAIRAMIWAYKNCDNHEWLLCTKCDWIWRIDEHVDEEPDFCPRCGSSVQLRLTRRFTLHLARIDLKHSLFPHRLYEFSSTKKRTAVTWYFRKWKICQYQRKNPMRWLADVTSDEEDTNAD